MNIGSLIILVLQEICRPLIFETFIWKINKGLSYLDHWCFGFFCYRRWNYFLSIWWASLVVLTVKNLPAMQETWVRYLGWEDALEEGMATHSSIFAWRIPIDRGPWRPMGSQTDMNEQLSKRACAHIHTHTHAHTHTQVYDTYLQEFNAATKSLLMAWEKPIKQYFRKTEKYLNSNFSHYIIPKYKGK